MTLPHNEETMFHHAAKSNYSGVHARRGAGRESSGGGPQGPQRARRDLQDDRQRGLPGGQLREGDHVLRQGPRAAQGLGGALEQPGPRLHEAGPPREGPPRLRLGPQGQPGQHQGSPQQRQVPQGPRQRRQVQGVRRARPQEESPLSQLHFRCVTLLRCHF